MPNVFCFGAIPPPADEATAKGNEPKLGTFSLPNDFIVLPLFDKAVANGFCFAYARNPLPSQQAASNEES